MAMMNTNPLMMTNPYTLNSPMNPSNPYMNNYNAMQNQMVNNLIRVTGMDGAKAYQMQPNSTVALFDSSEDIMYIKSTDGAGFPTIRTFGFAPIEQPTNQGNDFISRAEFEQFKQEVLDNGKQLISEPKSTTTGKLTSTK
nr:MAG TPA: hypothetical protein [Caudoviricetes sp.]